MASCCSAPPTNPENTEEVRVGTNTRSSSKASRLEGGNGNGGIVASIAAGLQGASQVMQGALGVVKEGMDSRIAKWLENMVDKALDRIGPLVGEEVMTRANKNEFFKRFDQATETDYADKVKVAATETVLLSRNLAHEYCQDIRYITEGSDVYEAASGIVKNVGVVIRRSLMRSIESAVDALSELAPPLCMFCCRKAIDFPKLIQEVYHDLVKTVEEICKNVLREMSVPTKLVDKVDWSGDYSPDTALPEPVSRGQKAMATAPATQSMSGRGNSPR